MALGDRVKQFSDIKGQQVGIIQSDYDRICFNRLLAKNSLAPTDVSIVDPGCDLVTPLVTNKLIMTTGAGSGERVIAAETAKKEIKFWDLATGAEVPYSVEKASAEAGLCPRIFIVILANTEWLKANPDTAKAFLAATMKGLKWAIENEDAAAAISPTCIQSPRRTLTRSSGNISRRCSAIRSTRPRASATTIWTRGTRS